MFLIDLRQRFERSRRGWVLIAFLVVLPFGAWPSGLGAVPAQAEEGGLAERYYQLGQGLEQAGKDDAAREHYQKVLEREARHLPTLYALAMLEARSGDSDAAVDYAGRFLDTWRYLKELPRDLYGPRKELADYLKSADPLRRELDQMRRVYVGRLLKFAEQQMDKGSWHSARAMLVEAIATDPEHPELAAGLGRIKLEGGNELAVEDETGGSDPLAGVTEEWVKENDARHGDWKQAWEHDTEHYRIRTNAGYRMLMTVANAMEQMHQFYREFHQYKTDGGSVPVAGVNIYKDRGEYKTLGGSPVEWAAGHWDGSKVVTYDQRGGGEGSLRGTLQVLFHEASHQFTTLAGGSSVPSWLNEGMASFFEGTRLLSNGRVDWNLVAPGRLYPLVDELRGGGRNSIENVIQGKVDDYRVYYPWGWGIVYYLYNAEDDSGRLLYRKLLPEYFQEYSGSDHLGRFTEFFIERAKVEGVDDLDEFERRFIAAMQRLEAEDKGQVDAARAYEERGDLQMALEDYARAVELYDRCLQRDPDHPEVLWKLSLALERSGQEDRTAGVLRQWLAVAELEEDVSEQVAERKLDALERIDALDPVARRLEATRRKFFEDSVALAGQYEEQGFPRTALRVLQGPATAQPPSGAARDLYFAIQDRHGVALEAWKLLFNERDLSGFYGDGQRNFRVVDGVLLADFDPEAEGGGRAPRNGDRPKGPTTGSTGQKGTLFQFRRLFIDHEPAGDWSLSAELALGKGCRLAGLCFGKKEDGLYHGIGILPEGFIDLSRIGMDATPIKRFKADLNEDWNRLQLDVAGTRVVAMLNGEIAIEQQFDTRAELSGDFGLLIGAGRSSFRNVRMLEYDRSMPRRATIGRRRSGARLSEGGVISAPERAPKETLSYQGQAPPLLRGLTWVTPAPGDGDLDKLLGWPVVLLFTKGTVEADPTFASFPALEKMNEEYGELEIPVLIISNERQDAVEHWVKTKEPPYAIASGWQQEVYEDYLLAKHGIPRMLLIDLDGTVVWEGNPDWDPEFGSYLDEPLAELVNRRHLRELQAAGPAIEAAEAAFQAGDFREAARIWSEIAAIDAPHPRVALSQHGLARLDERAGERIARAQELAGGGRYLQALAILQASARAFEGSTGGAKAARFATEMEESKPYKSAKRAGNRITRAEKALLTGKLAELEKQLGAVLEKSAPTDDPWVAERAQWLMEALAAGRPAEEILADYLLAFPELEDPRG